MTKHRLLFTLRSSPDSDAAFQEAVAPYDFRHVVTAERRHATLAITPDHDHLDDAIVDTMIGIGDTIRAGPVGVLLNKIVGSASSIALRPDRVLHDARDLQQPLQNRMQRQGLLRSG